MKYVMRAWGYRYENGQEIKSLCFLTKEGRLSRDKNNARLYDSEDEAWSHGIAASIGGLEKSEPIDVDETSQKVL